MKNVYLLTLSIFIQSSSVLFQYKTYLWKGFIIHLLFFFNSREKGREIKRWREEMKERNLGTKRKKFLKERSEENKEMLIGSSGTKG